MYDEYEGMIECGQVIVTKGDKVDDGDEKEKIS